MISPYVGVDMVQQRIDRGANWFYWVAALSLVNTTVAHSQGTISFFIGLGITQLIDALASGSSLTGFAIGIDLLVILTCAIVGQYARDSRVVYVAGIAAYSLDSLIFLAVGDFLGLGFHAFVLYWLIDGVKGFGQLKARERAAAAARSPLDSEAAPTSS